MGIYEKLNVDFEHIDSRGRLVQLVHDGYKQVNILESKQGVFRGGHYHKICREAFFVIKGKVEVTLKNSEIEESVVFQENDFFQINPNVIHSMFFPDDCLMIQMYDTPVEMDNGDKDIFPE